VARAAAGGAGAAPATRARAGEYEAERFVEMVGRVEALPGGNEYCGWETQPPPPFDP
jgi:hypothetical protein